MKGCKNCPAFAKCTVTYRGSGCAALRSTYGVETDPEIITNADRIRAMDDVEFCRQLKEMRDRKLYSALGFARFEDYAEQAVGIKWRQAYNYIQVYERLSPQLLEQNAGLGVTKLLLLTQVSAPDRAEFAGENDLAGMTVEEIKALISEKNGLAQQISMLETESRRGEQRDLFEKRGCAAAGGKPGKG